MPMRALWAATWRSARRTSGRRRHRRALPFLKRLEQAGDLRILRAVQQPGQVLGRLLSVLAELLDGVLDLPDALPSHLLERHQFPLVGSHLDFGQLTRRDAQQDAELVVGLADAGL